MNKKVEKAVDDILKEYNALFKVYKKRDMEYIEWMIAHSRFCDIVEKIVDK